MLRKIKVTPNKIPAIVRSLTMMRLNVDAALIEHQNYLDHNLKSPVMHNKLNQASNNLNDVVKFLESLISAPDSEVTEGITFKYHEASKLMLKLDEDTLDELIGNLKSVVGEVAA